MDDSKMYMINKTIIRSLYKISILMKLPIYTNIKLFRFVKSYVKLIEQRKIWLEIFT